MFFLIWGCNRLLRKCNEKSRPQKREIAENLIAHPVMNDGVSYQRQIMYHDLKCVNPQGP